MGSPVREPWEQRIEWSPRETDTAYEAFLIYRDLGRGRTIPAVAERLQKSGGLIARWSRTHDWGVRCSEWDSHLQRESDAHKLKLFHETRKADWEKAMSQRELDWQVVTMFKRKALTMASHPATTQTTEDGKTVIFAAKPDTFNAAGSLARRGYEIQAHLLSEDMLAGEFAKWFTEDGSVESTEREDEGPRSPILTIDATAEAVGGEEDDSRPPSPSGRSLPAASEDG